MAETSLKPGGMTINLAHAIERYFNVALFLLVMYFGAAIQRSYRTV